MGAILPSASVRESARHTSGVHETQGESNHKTLSPDGEMVDTRDSKSLGSNVVRVQVPLRAPISFIYKAEDLSIKP